MVRESTEPEDTGEGRLGSNLRPKGTASRCACTLLTSHATTTGDLPAPCSMDGLAQLILAHLATSLNIKFLCEVIQLITRTFLKSNVRVPYALGCLAWRTPLFTTMLVHCPGGNLLGSVF